MWRFNWIKVTSMFLAWAILLSLLPLQGSSGSNQPPASNSGSSSNQPSLPSSQPSSEGFTKYHKVVVSLSETGVNEELAKMGAILLSDKAYNLWRVSDAQYDIIKRHLDVYGDVKARLYDELDIIGSPMGGFNTLREPEPTIPATLRHTKTSQPQMWIIQYVSESPDGWFSFREAQGLDQVSMAGRASDIVWVDGSKVSELEAMVNAKGPIQWTGAYHPAYRVDAALQPYVDSTSQQLLKVVVQFYPKAGLPDAIERLKAAGGIVTGISRLGGGLVLNAKIPIQLLTQLALWPDLIGITPEYEDVLINEAQSQIVAGNIQTNMAGNS